MPTMPPTPWHGNTSSVSSSVDALFFQCTQRFEITLATVPMNMLSPMLTYTAAGVMATSPTTAPTQPPSADGLCPRIPSKKIQASPAAADAVLVVANAMAACPEADNAEPALKPNQPNQSIPVPRMTKGMFAGVCASPA